MELKDKTQITFYQGLNTIGGTYIEVSYQDARVLFDFGTEFKPEVEAQMPDYSITSLEQAHLIPMLSGYYDTRLPHKANRRLYNYDKTAVFLSHVHLDHSRMINYLDPRIKLYTSAPTKKLLEVLNQTGTFLLPSPVLDAPTTRELTAVPFNEPVHVGDITVEILPVDHDAYGAGALIITTPTAKIAYTGDLRLHGFQARDTQNFFKAARHADLLISEGVSASFIADPPKKQQVASERKLLATVKQIIAKNPTKMIGFNGYAANLLRLVKLGEIGNSTRKSVFTAETASLIKEIFQKDERYYTTETNLFHKNLDPSLEIPYHCLVREPEKYFIEIGKNFEMLTENSVYFHLDAEPLGDFDPEFQPFLADLAARKIDLVLMSCSGHATYEDLNSMIAAIEPKLLVPIHSFHPENLDNPFGERILPKLGQIISI